MYAVNGTAIVAERGGLTIFDDNVLSVSPVEAHPILHPVIQVYGMQLVLTTYSTYNLHARVRAKIMTARNPSRPLRQESASRAKLKL